MTEYTKRKVDLIDAALHEFKTSLTTIIASAGLLADELRVDEKSVQGKLIQGIIRNARTLDKKLSLLSEVDKMRAGDFRFQPEPIEIGQVIHSVAAQLYPLTQSKRQSLTVEVLDFLPLIKADRQYLEQILLNLLTNASNFTSEEGKIKVSAWQDNNGLVVEVSDTGLGIPVEEQKRIFEPYYQINGGKGSGLGLALAKFMVELHGGKIWLKSTVGQGSSFFFLLPLTEATES